MGQRDHLDTEGSTHIMAKRIDHAVEYHYDSYPTREDQMGETPAHANLVHYLIEVLRWYLRAQVCAVYENFNFYQTLDPNEYPLAPDIAIIKGVTFQEEIRSWKVWQQGIVPQVVFEIGSKETWKIDLEEKPFSYAQMGVQEYFAYDPNQPPLRKRVRHRLFGWQIDAGSRQMRELPYGIDGRLWSAELESWLVPDGKSLRLYDRLGHVRLTEAGLLAEKLRELGIDPDQL